MQAVDLEKYQDGSECWEQFPEDERPQHCVMKEVVVHGGKKELGKVRLLLDLEGVAKAFRKAQLQENS